MQSSVYPITPSFIFLDICSFFLPRRMYIRLRSEKMSNYLKKTVFIYGWIFVALSHCRKQIRLQVKWRAKFLKIHLIKVILSICLARRMYIRLRRTKDLLSALFVGAGASTARSLEIVVALAIARACSMTLFSCRGFLTKNSSPRFCREELLY